MYYFNDPVILSIEGDAAIIGPEVISLSGGMGGTYVKSIGKAGKAKLTVSDNYGKVMGMTEFNIAIND